MACTICGATAVAKLGEPEAAVAIALFLGCQGKDLDGFKRMMCAEHRRAWALLLVRGGALLGSP